MAAGINSRDRLYASTYNELEQASRAEESVYWDIDYLGRMRLDLLAFRKVVIPLNFITDGAFFLSIDPTDLLNSVTRTAGALEPAIEIRSSADSFDEALRNLFVRDDHLHGVVFDSLPDPVTRHTLARRLRSVDSHVLDDRLRHATSPARAIAGMLRELLRAEGLEPGEGIDRLERGWRNWSDISETRIRLKPWSPFASPFQGIMLGYFNTSRLGDEARDLLRQVCILAHQGKVYRSDLRLLFERARSNPSDRTHMEEISRVETFTERAWERAAALSYQCSYAYETGASDPNAERFTSLVSRLHSDDEILPPGAFRRIGMLPHESFQKVTTAKREELDRWWTSGDVDALRSTLVSLTNELDKASDPVDPEKQKAADLFVAVPGIGAGALAALASQDLLGETIATALASTIGSLGTVSALYATRYFRSRKTRSSAERLVEYCLGPG